LTALVYTPGLNFEAEIQIDGGPLNPTDMPDTFTGGFRTFKEVNTEIALLHIHSTRTDDGSSHKIWLNERRNGYIFSIDPPDSLHFKAVSLSVNPNTGLKGFQRGTTDQV